MDLDALQGEWLQRGLCGWGEWKQVEIPEVPGGSLLIPIPMYAIVPWYVRSINSLNTVFNQWTTGRICYFAFDAIIAKTAKLFVIKYFLQK